MNIPDDKDQGVSALLTLAATFLEEAKEPAKLITSLAHAAGVIRYFEDHVLNLGQDNRVYLQSRLEGTELARIFALNFEMKIPGAVYISIHSNDPTTGGVELLDTREKTFMSEENGEFVNVTSIVFQLPSKSTGRRKKDTQVVAVSFIGLWDEPEGGVLLDKGTINATLQIHDEDRIEIPPGGLRLVSG